MRFYPLRFKPSSCVAHCYNSSRRHGLCLRYFLTTPSFEILRHPAPMSSPQSFAGATATLLTGASPPNVCGHRPNVPMTDLTSILTSTSASSPQSTTSSPPTMASGFKVVAGSRCTIDPLDPNHKLFKTPGPLANGAPHIAQIIRSNSYPSVPLHPPAPKPVIPSENAKSGSRFVERLTDSHPSNPHTDAELARIVSEGASKQSRPQVQDRRLMGLIRKRSSQ